MLFWMSTHSTRTHLLVVFLISSCRWSHRIDRKHTKAFQKLNRKKRQENIHIKITWTYIWRVFLQENSSSLLPLGVCMWVCVCVCEYVIVWKYGNLSNERILTSLYLGETKEPKETSCHRFEQHRTLLIWILFSLLQWCLEFFFSRMAWTTCPGNANFFLFIVFLGLRFLPRKLFVESPQVLAEIFGFLQEYRGKIIKNTPQLTKYFLALKSERNGKPKKYCFMSYTQAG